MAIGRRDGGGRSLDDDDDESGEPTPDVTPASGRPTRGRRGDRRREKRSERSKLDATPPWQPKERPLVEATTGPYDVADAPQDGGTRIDLGALRVPTTALEMRVEVDEAQQVVAVTLINEDGHMQLGAFAAPRSEGIWDDVRAEIATSIKDQKGTAAETDGDFGTELRGRLPGDAGITPVRFVGVDGPRWLLRAMIVGAAAADATKGRPFVDLLREVVVVRGTDPLPVREPIPLRLPDEVAEQIIEQSEPAEG